MSEKVSEEVLERAVSTVMEYFEFCKTLRSRMEDSWLRWYELTRLFRLRGLNTRNRVYVPMCWQQVESIAPRVTRHDPVYQVVATRNSALAFTEIAADILMYGWHEKQLKRNARQLVKNGLTYGTGIAKIRMDYVHKTEVVNRMAEVEVEVEDPETGEIVIEKQEQEVEEVLEMSALPVFDVADIFDIYVDPRFECLDKMQAVIHRKRRMRIADLHAIAEEEGYFNLEEIEMMSGGGGANYADSDVEQKLNVRGIPSGMGAPDGLDVNDLDVYEYWGRFSETGNAVDEKEYCITIVNGVVPIGFKRNPYATDHNAEGVRPFERYVDSEVPGEFYGVGEVEPTESLQIGLSKTKNQRLDNVDLVVNRQVLVDRAAGVNPRALKNNAPGNIIKTDDMNGVRFLPIPDVTSSSYAEEDRYQRDFQVVTGTISGTGSGGRDDFVNTATGQKIRAGEQNSRFNAKVENFEATLERIGMKMLKMLHAMEDDYFVLRRKKEDGTGDKFTKVKGELFKEIVDGVGVRVKAGSTMSDDYEERRNDAIAAWNLASAAVATGVMETDELREHFDHLMKVAFHTDPMKKKGKMAMDVLKQGMAGLQKLAGGMPQGGAPAPAPAPGGSGVQISPETLSPNGVQPGVAFNPQG